MGLPTRLGWGGLWRSKEVETTLQRQNKELVFGKGRDAGLFFPGQLRKGRNCSPCTFLSLVLYTTISALQTQLSKYLLGKQGPRPCNSQTEKGGHDPHSNISQE